jgi:predicted AAA+ superfamily ATPase
MLDVGLLRIQTRLNPIIFREGHRLFIEFKGALSENYILQSLIAQFDGLISYWASDGKAEVDFLLQYKDMIIPIEVKSSDNVTSKSLSVYAKAYSPRLRIRFSLKNLEFSTDGLLNIPIFLADHSRKFIDLIIEKGL